MFTTSHLTDLKKAAIREKAIRELERRHSQKRGSLIEFIKYFFKQEKNKDFKDSWYHHVIANKLTEVLDGKCRRLIINIPPRHGKTELITKCFPVWALGKNPRLQIIATGYSADLTQTYSGEARDYYLSDTYKRVFPRRPQLRDDQNTKEWWKNTEDGYYYATGTGGSITGRGANIFIIDDPIKPDKAEDSEVERIGINNWYDRTVLSRLNDPVNDAVIVIMQRTHENDLCGYLLERESKGLEKWDQIILPAISEKEDEYRKEGEPLDPLRYPIKSLEVLKQGMSTAVFSCQYQQNPIAKESQEFHEEWFKYYDSIPSGGRIFTTCDPAFTQKKASDYTAIVTAKFIKDEMYILEATHGKFNPAELEDKLVYHVRKWSPEKIGIEAFQAQSMIAFSLKNRLRTERLYTTVEEIKQTGDKLTKIRRLIPLYRNGQIYHKTDLADLENELIKFPRGTHDDLIDALQMLYNLYELQPNTESLYSMPVISYNEFGQPVIG